MAVRGRLIGLSLGVFPSVPEALKVINVSQILALVARSATGYRPRLCPELPPASLQSVGVSVAHLGICVMAVASRWRDV